MAYRGWAPLLRWPSCKADPIRLKWIRSKQRNRTIRKAGVAFLMAIRPVTVPDIFRSVAAAMALDPDKTRFAPSGRPIKTVDGGAVIGELF